jgi:hypothetical protein
VIPALHSGSWVDLELISPAAVWKSTPVALRTCQRTDKRRLHPIDCERLSVGWDFLAPDEEKSSERLRNLHRLAPVPLGKMLNFFQISAPNP